MPLQVSTESPSVIAKLLESSTSKPSFLVVYASLTNGKSWCGDCRRAEPFVNAKFANRQDAVNIVYVGQVDEYESLQPPFKSTQLCGQLKWPEGRCGKQHQGNEAAVRGNKLTGHRWRKENAWEKEPFWVTHLPTIIKVTKDGVSTRKDSKTKYYHDANRMSRNGRDLWKGMFMTKASWTPLLETRTLFPEARAGEDGAVGKEQSYAGRNISIFSLLVEKLSVSENVI